MATAKPGAAPELKLPKYKNLKIAVVQAEWNRHITSALTAGALDRLHDLGYGNGDDDSALDVFFVPGTVELTFAARQLMKLDRYHAIIIVGCVIRGDTPHFDYVCQSVTQGMTELNLMGKAPVIFCVLTVNDEQAALDRAGGRLGNKGTEAAEAALAMVRFSDIPNQ